MLDIKKFEERYEKMTTRERERMRHKLSKSMGSCIEVIRSSDDKEKIEKALDIMQANLKLHNNSFYDRKKIVECVKHLDKFGMLK